MLIKTPTLQPIASLSTEDAIVPRAITTTSFDGSGFRRRRADVHERYLAEAWRTRLILGQHESDSFWIGIITHADRVAVLSRVRCAVREGAAVSCCVAGDITTSG